MGREKKRMGKQTKTGERNYKDVDRQKKLSGSIISTPRSIFT